MRDAREYRRAIQEMMQLLDESVLVRNTESVGDFWHDFGRAAKLVHTLEWWQDLLMDDADEPKQTLRAKD